MVLLISLQSGRVLELSSILLLTMLCRNLMQYLTECSNFVSSYKAPQLCQSLLLTQNPLVEPCLRTGWLLQLPPAHIQL